MSAVAQRKRVTLLVALLLPLVGTAGLIVRGEIALGGREWRFPIRGFDPRDLLRGRYLTYRILWGETDGEPPCERCCLCLERESGEQVVTRIECSEASRCDARLAVDDVEDLQRFYVPETHATALERAVIEERGGILLSAVGGTLAIKELLVDGKPWREALGPGTP
jgi:hypothetical protein